MTQPTDRSRAGTARRRPGQVLVFQASVAFALVPVAVAAARAAARGWIPLSDDALFSIRARDVFSYHHVPLIGLVSSASLSAGSTLNHPGPMLFDLLAVPVAAFGGHAGVALGTGLINMTSIVLIAVFAYRRGGALLGSIAMAATAGLCWTMGSEALFEPWQPFSLLIPFLCFLFLAWSVSCGDLVALPVAAVVGSLVLQSHLSYALLVPTLAVWALVGLALQLRAARRQDPASWAGLRDRSVRAGLLAVGVMVVCWIQPVIDQISGEGNLGQLIDNAKPPSRTFGYGYGARLVASVMALPPWWLRPSMNRTLFPATGWHPPSALSAAGSLAALVAVLVACAWMARRRHLVDAGRAVVTVFVGLAAGLATAGRIPITAFGLEAHVFWWLWPLSVFTFFAVAATIASRFATDGAGRGVVIGAAVVGSAVFASLAVPTLAQGLSPNTRQDATSTTRAVDDQLGRLRHRGPILIDPLFHSRIADPYGTAFVAELQRRGISFVTGDPALARQIGLARRYTGRDARSVLYLRVGNDPLPAPPGTPRVAFHDGLAAPERAELSTLRNEIVDYVQAGRLRLNHHGEVAAARGVGVPTPEALLPPRVDAPALLASGALVDLFRHGYLRLDAGWMRRLARYAQLADREDAHTVALFLEPLRGRPLPIGRLG
jgi:hypothetical protein